MDRTFRDPFAILGPSSVPAPRSSPTPPAARAWRCRSCGLRLGVEHRGQLHVKHKHLQLFIIGRCRQSCRRCGALNTRDTSPASPATIAARSGGAR